MADQEVMRPTFRDAYWVEIAGGDGRPLGFVRRQGAIWFLFRLGVAAEGQLREGFATREQAGQRLIEMATVRAKHAAP